MSDSKSGTKEFWSEDLDEDLQEDGAEAVRARAAVAITSSPL